MAYRSGCGRDAPPEPLPDGRPRRAPARPSPV